MDTALSQHSPNVQNLAAYGIKVRNLRTKSLWDHRWALTVIMPFGMEKQVFKRHVANFLEVEFEASEFEWSQSNRIDPTAVTVTFKSFAL